MDYSAACSALGLTAKRHRSWKAARKPRQPSSLVTPCSTMPQRAIGRIVNLLQKNINKALISPAPGIPCPSIPLFPPCVFFWHWPRYPHRQCSSNHGRSRSGDSVGRAASLPSAIPRWPAAGHARDRARRIGLDHLELVLRRVSGAPRDGHEPPRDPGRSRATPDGAEPYPDRQKSACRHHWQDHHHQEQRQPETHAGDGPGEAIPSPSA